MAIVKTPRWRTLMVAVGATDKSARPLLRKALQLANHFEADLQLLHVIAPTYAYVPDELKQKSKELQVLVENMQRDSSDVTITVVRDYPVADAIIRQVMKYKPDMLIAESHRHGTLSRMLMGQTDWELIRNCSCPLWLSKSYQLPRNLKVLAAIDPYHTRAKPTRLDDIILRTALAVADDEPEQVIACHTYTPPSTVVPAMTAELYWEPVSERELRRYEGTVRKTIERRLARYGIPSRNRVIVPGDPAASLVQAAKRHHANVLVMGAISRSALKRFFIGNTAERVIDEVACDLLVVKPTGFRTPVSRRSTRPVFAYPVPRAESTVSTHL